MSKMESVSFREPGAARSNLARLKQRLGPGLLTALDALVRESADPDGVLNLLERYAEPAPASLIAELGRRPRALTYLTAAFAQGSLLAEPFLAEPGLALQFARDRYFADLRSHEDLMEDYARFSTTESGLNLAEKLARFKRRNYARIALKDVLGMATLAETTLELSALADVIVAQALLDADRELAKRYGQPQYRDARDRIARSGFSVVSLGKLGGNELNYSSDIDLLFLYARDGETAGTGSPGSVVTNREYFTRLAQAIATCLTQMTPAGQVFRVDLRLRPEGDQGDLTLSLASALDYYARRARDWELQMLIKARHSAGAARLTRAFLQGVNSLIYSSPASVEAVRSILSSRERMSQRLLTSRSDTIDVKRHPGGIRDIELLTQCLQRLYGAREPWVRSGGTLHALRKLNDKGLLSDRDYATLTTSYEFLRRIEHRIQLDRGQQSHRLPAEREALDRLARRTGIEADAEQSPGRTLLARLHVILDRVSDVYRRLIDTGTAEPSPGKFELKPASVALDTTRHSFPSVLRRLEAQAPELASLVRDAEFPPRARPRLVRFLAGLVSSREALALARERPRALERAFGVLRISDYLSDLLIRRPKDLIVLASGATQPVPGGQLDMSLLPQTPEHASADVEGPGAATGCASGAGFTTASPFPWLAEKGLSNRDKMALLRQSYRAHSLELGARDCIEPVRIYDSLRSWTALAATSVATAFALALQDSAGETSGDVTVLAFPGEDAPHPEDTMASSIKPSGTPAIAVLSLGRLGLSEFDLGSDADLVFVMDSRAAPEQTPGAIRVAEKIIEALSSYTRDGAVFAVDTRLRPRGSEGELVVTEDALLEYAASSAHAWEALSYLKACPIAGDPELGWRVASRLTAQLFDRFAADPGLARSLQEMRRRLEKELRPRSSLTKTAPGGYYDVDFAVSYLRLRERLPLLAGSNTAQQIAALREAGILKPGDSADLAAGASFLRAVDHAERLVMGRPVRGFPERSGQVEGVEQLLRSWGYMADEGASSLQARLTDVQQQVRVLFDRALACG
jgi:[glutamine synthetase] adenylyltransferase / [glutamine synthetase]-adenylyl-L-tyrosine phosphorylase